MKYLYALMVGLLVAVVSYFLVFLPSSEQPALNNLFSGLLLLLIATVGAVLLKIPLQREYNFKVVMVAQIPSVFAVVAVLSFFGGDFFSIINVSALCCFLLAGGFVQRTLP